MPNRFRIRGLLATAGVSVLLAAISADTPPVYAIRGARLVTVAGPAIDSGTLLVRDGRIEALGSDVTAPEGAVIVEGDGLTVYPGLIDLSGEAGLKTPAYPEPRNPETREQVERAKRERLLHPELRATDLLDPDASGLARLAAAGVTNVLAVPPGEVFKGQSALLHTLPAPETPQIGDLADPRAATLVVRTPVALHVAMPARPEGRAYPQSLMGVIAFVRQAFLDARHHAQAASSPGRRVDPSLSAMQPAVERRMPVVFEADSAREIRRALALAGELGLDPIISGGAEADQTVEDLQAAGAQVIVSLDFPKRPEWLAPEADEPLRTLRSRANAPAVPAALSRAGIRFGFGTDGLKGAGEILGRVRTAVGRGLPEDAAIRALTLDAATIAGVADRLGSLERGKTANLVVVEGDLLAEKPAIRHLFIEGRLRPVPEPEGERTAGR